MFVPGVVGQGLAPDVGHLGAWVQDPDGQGQGGGGQHAGGHRHHGVGAQRQFHDVPWYRIMFRMIINRNIVFTLPVYV